MEGRGKGDVNKDYQLGEDRSARLEKKLLQFSSRVLWKNTKTFALRFDAANSGNNRNPLQGRFKIGGGDPGGRMGEVNDRYMRPAGLNFIGGNHEHLHVVEMMLLSISVPFQRGC